jgi:hypothetical protein
MKKVEYIEVQVRLGESPNEDGAYIIVSAHMGIPATDPGVVCMRLNSLIDPLLFSVADSIRRKLSVAPAS